MADFIALVKGIVARIKNAFFFLPNWCAAHHLKFLAWPVFCLQIVVLGIAFISLFAFLHNNGFIDGQTFAFAELAGAFAAGVGVIGMLGGGNDGR